jgi:hypothetical protein
VVRSQLELSICRYRLLRVYFRPLRRYHRVDRAAISRKFCSWNNSLYHIWILKRLLLACLCSRTGIVSFPPVLTEPISLDMLTEELRLYRIMHAIISGRLLLKIRQAASSSGVQYSTKEVGMDPSAIRAGNAMEMRPLRSLQPQSHPAAKSPECVNSPSKLDSGLPPGIESGATF